MTLLITGANAGGHVRPRRSAHHEDWREEGQTGAYHQGAQAAQAEVPEHGGRYGLLGRSIRSADLDLRIFSVQ